MNTATTESAQASSLLALLHIASPALPVGAFAYSQGLEYALDSGWCRDRDQVAAWINDNLLYGLGQLDLPVYRHLYQAWQDQDQQALVHWNQTLLSFRESKELYLEDTQVGHAFAQWHLGQDSQRQALLDLCPTPTVVAMNALAAVLTDIALPQALLGFAWSWAENQIACASKAMPMGQTDGQKILQALIPLMAEVCERAARLSDEEIGTGMFGTAIASSLHEHQYSRLFRS